MRVLTIAALLVATASAAFVANEPPQLVAKNDVAVDNNNVDAPPYDVNTALSALYYSKSAYCDAAPLASWTCTTCSYNPTLTSIKVFTYDDLQAYAGYNPTTNQVIVAFRGSSNIPNWISDLTFLKVPYPPCQGSCEVHDGFYSVWMGLQPLMNPYIRVLLNEHPSAQLFVTGHSLGAAVSILAALELTLFTELENVVLYNFGEPRVGDKNFAAYAAAHLPQKQQYRITHHKDPVPHVPPMDFGFLHTPHEIFYDNNGATSYYNCNDSTSAEDPKCSDQYLIPDAISDHLLYLGISTECD